jgi:ferrous iron transport protein A
VVAPFLIEEGVTTPTRLSEIPRSTPFAVVRVDGDDALSRRLIDLGFVPGATVALDHVSLFSWPRAFRLHGYRLALRRDEASRVAVEALR